MTSERFTKMMIHISKSSMESDFGKNFVLFKLRWSLNDSSWHRSKVLQVPWFLKVGIAYYCNKAVALLRKSGQCCHLQLNVLQRFHQIIQQHQVTNTLQLRQNFVNAMMTFLSASVFTFKKKSFDQWLLRFYVLSCSNVVIRIFILICPANPT